MEEIRDVHLRMRNPLLLYRILLPTLMLLLVSQCEFRPSDSQESPSTLIQISADQTTADNGLDDMSDHALIQTLFNLELKKEISLVTKSSSKQAQEPYSQLTKQWKMQRRMKRQTDSSGTSLASTPVISNTDASTPESSESLETLGKDNASQIVHESVDDNDSSDLDETETWDEFLHPGKDDQALDQSMETEIDEFSETGVKDNLAKLGVPKLHLHPPTYIPPEYMVNLFFLLSDKHYDMLVDTVVTGFVNLNEDDPKETETQCSALRHHSLGFTYYMPKDKERIEYSELRLYLVHKMCARSSENDTQCNNSFHPQSGEDVKNLQNVSVAHEWKPIPVTLRIYEVVKDGNDDSQVSKRLVASRYLQHVTEGWEIFIVTPLVKHWTTSGLKVFEVELETLALTENTETNLQTSSNSSCVNTFTDIAMSKHQEPLLVVFSRKFHDSHPRKREKREIRKLPDVRELEAFWETLSAQNAKNVNRGDISDNLWNSFQNTIKQEAMNGAIKHTPAVVRQEGNAGVHDHQVRKFLTNIPDKDVVRQEFTRSKQINSGVSKISGNIQNNKTSDSLAVQKLHKIDRNASSSKNIEITNVESEAKEQTNMQKYGAKVEDKEKLLRKRFQNSKTVNHDGRSSLDSVSPIITSNESNFQRKLNISIYDLIGDSRKHFKNQVEDEDKFDTIKLWRLRRDTKRRYRRHVDSLFRDGMSSVFRRLKRSKRRPRNSCRRKDLYVNFERIMWDTYIMFPRTYNAHECTGKCYTPISEYLTPTKHAIIQTLVHTSYPKEASRACCVPTKLGSISILYWDENGQAKYEFAYDDMVVDECGCR